MDFKQTYSTTRWEIYGDIIILYDGITRYASEMIKEYYSGSEWAGTAFLLTPCYGFDFSISRPITRDSVIELCNRYNLKIQKFVFWNFDHLHMPGYLDTLNKYLKRLSPDEIWEWQIEIFKKMPYTLKDRVRFMPLRYVSAYGGRQISQSNTKYDFLFIGNINTLRRAQLLGKLTSTYTPILITTGYDMEDLEMETSRCRAVLNIRGESGNYREQLRISECICRNIPIVTETDTYPYYPELTGEYNYDSAIANAGELYTALDNAPKNISNRYRIMTQPDFNYESYKKSILNYY